MDSKNTDNTLLSLKSAKRCNILQDGCARKSVVMPYPLSSFKDMLYISFLLFSGVEYYLL